MRMSHVYQPVMLMTLFEKGGKASTRDIAKAILEHDESQIEYYEKIVGIAPAGLPLVQVICPKRAYEYETVHLTVLVTGLPKGSKSLTCTVETSENIEVQGSLQRQVVGKEDWFLIPKEQGEYIVVVRGLATAKGLPFEQPLSVFKIDHIPRRWYVVLLAIASVIGFIGTLKRLWSKGKTASEQAVP